MIFECLLYKLFKRRRPPPRCNMDLDEVSRADPGATSDEDHYDNHETESVGGAETDDPAPRNISKQFMDDCAREFADYQGDVSKGCSAAGSHGLDRDRPAVLAHQLGYEYQSRQPTSVLQ